MEIKDIQALIEENKRLAAQVEKLTAEKAELENAVSSLKSMMEWYRKKLFGKMSEKNLPLDPSVLEPTLFDEQLSEEEQVTLDAEVKAMEEQNARVIEVKAHKREVRTRYTPTFQLSSLTSIRKGYRAIPTMWR